ncbi:MAG: ArsR/SmtB family transcription factor [Rhodospirillaceae bacterium]
MNVEAVKTKSREAADFLKSMANDRRLVVLCELVKGERSVGELEAVAGLSQSALSQHLARLREARVVKTRRESQTIYYSLANESVKRLIDVLYDLYCRPIRGRRR